MSLYVGETRGVPYFPLDAIRTRARYFGGTTNEWAGECRPLDPMDFDHRAWVPLSGWPIGPADLLPFYAKAQELWESLGGPGDVSEQQLDGVGRLDSAGWRVTKGPALFPRDPPAAKAPSAS